MPLEFTEIETRESSRKRLAVRALIAIACAAVIGAGGVYGTIMVLNSFASDTVREIEEDRVCDAFDLVDNIVPPDPETDDGAITAAHEAFQEQYRDEFGPVNGWHGSGITHTSDGFTIVVFVEEPQMFEFLPDEYDGVAVEVCGGGPFEFHQ